MPSFGHDQVEGVMGRLTAALTDISTAFERAAGPITKFVEAISPGQVQVFNLAMRDLNATIGSAFVPVMQVLTEGVRKAASLIVPAVDALAPVFRSLSEALLSFMLPAVQTISHALKGMAPLFDGIAQALHTLGDLFGVINVIMLSAKDAFADFFKAFLGGGAGGGLKDIFAGIKDAVYRFMITLITVSATIAKIFGATGFIDHLKKNLSELAKPGEGGKGGGFANVSIKGIEQIGKDIAQAAATAAGTGQKGKGIEELAAEALLKLDGVVNSVTPLEKILTALPGLIGEAVARAIGGAKAAVAEQAQDIIKATDPAAIWERIRPNWTR
jgi:hypothetical protein